MRYIRVTSRCLCFTLPINTASKNTHESNRGFTYGLSAGVFGGHVEVDHILPHDDVRNPITIISNLTWPQKSYEISVNTSHTPHTLQMYHCVCHSQGRTLRPARWSQGGSSGRTAPSAEPGSGWWRDARAPIRPGRRKGVWSRTCEGGCWLFISADNRFIYELMTLTWFWHDKSD